MAVFMVNFQAPKDIEDLIWAYEQYGRTNLDVLLTDAANGDELTWTVPSNSTVGDTVILVCASTAKDHIGHVCVQAKAYGNDELLAFAEEQRVKYRMYSGKVLAVGAIGEMPYPDDAFGPKAYSAKIVGLKILDEPIPMSEFKGSISLNRFGSHTKLNGWQWELIKRRIER